ncbi:MAG: lysozyme [Xanthomonadales bacterium]|nr:lysozyme [Xanthomonadales bacterium]
MESWVPGATIGYGHLINQSEWEIYKNGITQVEAETLLSQDLAQTVKYVNSVLDGNVTQRQFDAAVMLAFNIGSNFGSSSVVKMMNSPTVTTDFFDH